MVKRQVEKAYGNDWAKSKSRTLVREMIERTLLSFRRPKDLRVICFPGVDAAEIYEVYDPLKIPRENILGVERDREVAQEVERKNLGIQLYKGSLEELVSSRDSFNFDIMSLDYIGPFTPGQFMSMRRLTRSSRRNSIVVHIANLLRRDHLAKEIYQLAHATQVSPKGEEEDYLEWIKKSMDEYSKREEEAKKQLDEGDSPALKKAVYSYIIKTLYSQPESPTRTAAKVLNFVSPEGYKHFIDMWLRQLKRPEKNLTEQASLKLLESLADVDSNLVISSLELFLDFEIGELIKGRKLPESSKIFLRQAIQEGMSQEKRFETRERQGYTYISESGSPMIGEIAFIHHPERYVVKARDLVSRLGYPKTRLTLPESNLELFKELSGILKNYPSIPDEETHEEAPTFLGSSARPVLTKARAIEEFKAGASIEDIQRKYRGFENKPLAAWKAHVTMGTYNRIPEDNGDIEKISKEEAIDLLKSGVPVEDIHETYPTSFTPNQLRAFKAWITMKKY